MAEDPIFSPSFGNRPSRLVGRDDVIRALVDGLGSRPGSRERATLIIGQRGSGKTVLLWELADRAREAGFVVASPTIAMDGMLDRIIEKIQDDGERSIGKAKPRVSGGTVGAFGFSAGLQFERDQQQLRSFQSRLSRLCAELGEQGKGLLILVDEVQANSPEVRQLVAAYQELVGERRDIALAMAGLPASITATLNDHVLTFLNRARKVELDPLRFDEVDAYFAQSFEELGLEMVPELRREASRAVQGSPYMLQLIGHNVVLYAGDAGKVGERVLSDALQAAREDFESDVCGTTLAALSGKDVEFLEAMSGDASSCDMKAVASRMGVTADYAQKYRKRLLDAGIIVSPRRGQVAFAVPYLADYLRRKH